MGDGAENPMGDGAENPMGDGAENPMGDGAENPMGDGAENPMGEVSLRSEASLVLVETFTRAGVLDVTATHFATTLHRLRPEEPDTVLLAGALAMRAPQWGHICFVPEVIAQTVVVDDGAAVGIDELPWPLPVDWTAAIAESALVDDRSDLATRDKLASPDAQDAVPELRPLVWDGTRLYLQRYWAYEENVANQIVDRLGTATELSGTAGTEAARADDTTNSAVAELQLTNGSPSQILAATNAMTRPLTVITGGPGTGKTFTVAAIVATLLQRDAERGDAALVETAGEAHAPISIALAAPTGKAAQRLTEAVRAVGTDASIRPELKLLEAVTIHRLLGAHPNGFRHNSANPLPADVVIVDEMSMVSLPLMSRLLDAVQPDARLVLVGDPHQLASVEAGSVLRDLVDGLLPAPGGPMCALEQVFRQKETSPIIPLAEAARVGDASRVLDLLQNENNALTLVDPANDKAVAELLDGLGQQADAVVAAVSNPERAHALLAGSRVLAASRRGPNGRHVWNSHIERRLSRPVQGSRARLARWYAGRPVIVTENDYLNRLMNGDVGVVVPAYASSRSGERASALESSDADQVMVVFPRGDEMVHVPPSRLHAVDTVWAMTIHKSQGSEFDNVVIALPEAPSPLLTRELVYTAITRARVGVTIVASEEALRSAMRRSVSRSSGLGLRLLQMRTATEPQQLSLWE